MVQRNNRPTVADLRAMKACGQKISMLPVATLDEAAAAAAAGVHMLSIEARFFSPEMRAAAGDCFVQVGLPYGGAGEYVPASGGALGMNGPIVATAEQHDAPAAARGAAHDEAGRAADAIVVDAKTGDAGRVGHPGDHVNDGLAAFARRTQRRLDQRRVRRRRNQAASSIIGSGERIGERDIVRLRRDAAVDDDALVEKRAGVRHSAAQPQKERRTAVGRQYVEAHQFVRRTGQDTRDAQSFGGGDHLAARLFRCASTFVQHAIDGRRADARLGGDLDKSRGAFATLAWGHTRYLGVDRSEHGTKKR